MQTDLQNFERGTPFPVSFCVLGLSIALITGAGRVNLSLSRTQTPFKNGSDTPLSWHRVFDALRFWATHFLYGKTSSVGTALSF
jgi:hypothetical protein